MLAWTDLTLRSMDPHDIPPPPYSETDIYSATDQHAPLTQTNSQGHADDASIAASSSQSNIIYTPPDTPQESHHGFTGAEDYQTTASAQVYFEARTASRDVRNAAGIVHSIVITEDPSPSDFPYPNWAASRDVSEQDWRTFINYLIPDFADKANACIIDRKMRASQDDASSSASTRDAMEAQLDQLRWSSQKRRFADTIKEWNAGFFGPRGVSIKLFDEDTMSEPKVRMPGEWDSSFDAGPTTAPAPAPGPGGQAAQETGGWRSLFGQRFGMNMDDGVVRIGPFRIDNNSVTIGNAFEADNRGVRWNGRDISEHMPNYLNPDRNVGGSRGRGRGSWWHERGDFHHRRFEHGGPGARRRSHSRHSVHSASSDSSSSSDSDSTVSSIGSLPDWDDLKDSQLPVVKQSVQSWLGHPDQPVTKADIKRARAEIKAAKSLPQPSTTDVRQREEIKTLLSMFNDLKKSQRANLKAAKRERRTQKRAERRAKRSRDRAERRESGRQRREHRRTEREHGRQQHRSRGGAPDPFFPHGGAQGQMPGQSPTMPPLMRSVPPPPHVAGAPPVPPVPHFRPGAFPFFGPSHSGGPWSPFGGFEGGGTHHQGSWSRHSPPAAESSQAQQAGHSDAQAREQPAQTIAGAAQQRALAALQRAQEAVAAAQAQVEAQRQADQAKAEAKMQAEHAKTAAERAKAAAKQQAEQAKLLAKQQADEAKRAAQAQAQAQRQAEQAKATARQQAEQARVAAEQAKAAARQQAEQTKLAARRQADEAKRTAKQQADQAKARAKEEKARAKFQAKKGKGQAKVSAAAQEAHAAKYLAAEQLEQQIRSKVVTLEALQQSIQAEGIAAAQAGQGDAKRTGQSQTELDAEALEGEIEELGRRIEQLIVEADEEYAKAIDNEEAEPADEGKVRWLD